MARYKINKERFLREFEQLASDEYTGPLFRELLQYFNNAAINLLPELNKFLDIAKRNKNKYKAWLEKVNIEYAKRESRKYRGDYKEYYEDITDYDIEDAYSFVENFPTFIFDVVSGSLSNYSFIETIRELEKAIISPKKPLLSDKIYELFYHGEATQAKWAWHFFSAYFLLKRPPLEITKKYLGDQWDYDLKKAKFTDESEWDVMCRKAQGCIAQGNNQNYHNISSSRSHEKAIMDFVGDNDWTGFKKWINKRKTDNKSNIKRQLHKISTKPKQNRSLISEEQLMNIVSPKVKQPKPYEINDDIGKRVLVVPANEHIYSGNPIPIVLDIEAKTRTRIKEGQNPVWFIRLWRHFQERHDPYAKVSFAEFCTKRHPDKIDVTTAVAHTRMIKAEFINKLRRLQSMTISGLIREAEGHQLEFKETLEYDLNSRKKSPKALRSCLKTIAGFLNSDGGVLIIGISDEKKVTGIENEIHNLNISNDDKYELIIRNCLNNRFEPSPTGKVMINFNKHNNRKVCRLCVEPMTEVVYFDKEVFVRDGNKTQKLEGRSLTDWIRQRNGYFI